HQSHFPEDLKMLAKGDNADGECIPGRGVDVDVDAARAMGEGSKIQLAGFTPQKLEELIARVDLVARIAAVEVETGIFDLHLGIDYARAHIERARKRGPGRHAHPPHDDY